MVEVIANEKTKEEALRDAFASAMESACGEFHEREVAAMKVANELVRHWLGGELERMAEGLERRLISTPPSSSRFENDT